MLLRNYFLLTAMVVGLTGTYLLDGKLFVAGAIIALTGLFIKESK